MVIKERAFFNKKSKLSFKDKFRGKVPKEFNAHQFLGAAKQSIDNSSFHAIPWVTQDVHWITKVIFFLVLYFKG